MGEYKFLCPRCHKLLDEFIDYYVEKKDYYAVINKEGEIEYVDSKEIDRRHISSFCPECDYGLECYSSDLIVWVTDDGDIEPIGYYWLEHKELLAEIKAKMMMR